MAQLVLVRAHFLYYGDTRLWHGLAAPGTTAAASLFSCICTEKGDIKK